MESKSYVWQNSFPVLLVACTTREEHTPWHVCNQESISRPYKLQVCVPLPQGWVPKGVPATKGFAYLFVVHSEMLSVAQAVISFNASGVGLSPFYCGHFWPIVPAPDDIGHQTLTTDKNHIHNKLYAILWSIYCSVAEGACCNCVRYFRNLNGGIEQ
jgi:hypothetical protein